MTSKSNEDLHCMSSKCKEGTDQHPITRHQWDQKTKGSCFQEVKMVVFLCGWDHNRIVVCLLMGFAHLKVC